MERMRDERFYQAQAMETPEQTETPSEVEAQERAALREGSSRAPEAAKLALFVTALALVGGVAEARAQAAEYQHDAQDGGSERGVSEHFVEHAQRDLVLLEQEVSRGHTISEKRQAFVAGAFALEEKLEFSPDDAGRLKDAIGEKGAQDVLHILYKLRFIMGQLPAPSEGAVDAISIFHPPRIGNIEKKYQALMVYDASPDFANIDREKLTAASLWTQKLRQQFETGMRNVENAEDAERLISTAVHRFARDFLMPHRGDVRKTRGGTVWCNYSAEDNKLMIANAQGMMQTIEEAQQKWGIEEGHHLKALRSIVEKSEKKFQFGYKYFQQEELRSPSGDETGRRAGKQKKSKKGDGDRLISRR